MLTWAVAYLLTKREDIDDGAIVLPVIMDVVIVIITAIVLATIFGCGL